MQSFAEQIFTPRERMCLIYARYVVESLPEPEGEPLRCHEVARVVVWCLDPKGHVLTPIDGLYGEVEHSWILIRGSQPVRVLDPYVVGRLPQVQLIDPFVPGAERFNWYRAGRPRTDIDWALVRELVWYIHAGGALDRWDMDALSREQP